MVLIHLSMSVQCVVDECLIYTMSFSAVSSPSPSYHDLQAMAMGFGVVSFIVILLLVVAIITAVVLYARELLYIYCTHCAYVYMVICYGGYHIMHGNRYVTDIHVGVKFQT